MLSRAARNLSQGVRASSARSSARSALPAVGAAQKRGFHTSMADLKGEDASPLRVEYWTGKPAVDPDSIKIDLSKYDVRRILSERNEDGSVAADMDLRDTQMLKQHIDELFIKTGAVHLVNTGLSTYGEFEALNSITGSTKDYKGGANMRAPQEKNVYDTGAPKEADLQYHHEMAYLNESPEKIAFFALEVTDDPLKGATYISENNGATQMLMEHDFGHRLVEKGCCYVRKLPDQQYFIKNKMDPRIVYNFWQTSTGSQDMTEAQKNHGGEGARGDVGGIPVVRPLHDHQVLCGYVRVRPVYGS
jgi:hypothetical protein